MSLILLSGVATGALWYLAQDEHRRAVEADQLRKHQITKRQMSTGTYGSMADISNVANKQGVFVAEEWDTDLQGVPCRWLYMQNGAAYRTYDLKTDFVGCH